MNRIKRRRDEAERKVSAIHNYSCSLDLPREHGWCDVSSLLDTYLNRMYDHTVPACKNDFAW